MPKAIRSTMEKLRGLIEAAAPQWTIADTPAPPFCFRKRRRKVWRAPPRSGFQAESNIIIADARDWRSGGRHFAPLNQGECNSCTAFALAATMSDLAQLAGRALSRPLSPGFIHTCLGRARCEEQVDPGIAAEATKVTAVPLMEVGDYPYSPASCPAAVGVLRARETQGLASMNEALAALQRGPILGVMEAYEDFWSYYSSGIYRHVAGAYLTSHSIEIVGYDRPGSYWIVKNSLGTGWGEQGYARIAFGECGILVPGKNGALQITVA